MQRFFSQVIGVYVVAAMIVVFATLGAWAAWGSPSTFSLVWIAIVSAGLIGAIALAVRDGTPTRSVAQVLYDTEHPLGDTPGNAPQRATSGGSR